MMEAIRISVRTLVEYVFKRGSIDQRFKAPSSLLEGTKAHQKIQKDYVEGDESEVFLQMVLPMGHLHFHIEGRCDGLLHSEKIVTIDEIKSTSLDLDEISEETFPVHWAQAKCYAYMYASQNNLEEIQVQLTYYQIHTGDRKNFRRVYQLDELEVFIHEVAKEYMPFAALQSDHEKKKQESFQMLEFPYSSYRKGQRKFAGAVYKTILDEKNLLANAPTGIGKTMSTIFPAVKAMGEGVLSRIFYLTAKTITRTVAEQAFHDLGKSGLHLKSITLTAKDKVCFKEETICQKDYCEFADGYYDRINGAMLDILANETQMTRSVIEAYARKHRVCPFEFSIDLAYTVDAVIGDYNYVFDPRVSLKRYLEEQKSKTVLLIDEAHNLVDRARDMFSAELTKSAFLTLKREYKGIHHGIFQAAKEINQYFIDLKKKCSVQHGIIKLELPEDFLPLVETFIEEAEKELPHRQNEVLLDAYFSALSFQRISKLYDGQYMTYAEASRNDVTLKLFCLDPSSNLQKMAKGFRSKIFFSATLSPTRYFQDLLGLTNEDYMIKVPSPFDEEQLELFIQPLSTRYHDREASVLPIIHTIQSLLESKKGNYLVFFPSYRYMEVVHEAYCELHPTTQVIKQEAGMPESVREEFLLRFSDENKETLLGFTVLGGIFSEGIDLKGDRLNGVVIVGVGLPQLSAEREMIKDHFEAGDKPGYDYSYVFPGMNKVLQAGGRLIRSESDRGTIILIDDRFLQRKYQSLLPDHWRHYRKYPNE
ncbi:ATP-dependent DNA helicase [Falsibacillus albus]|uniref:ATP-dependent DNA helicase n=1 Tax=Falsibacillus albus TaxID=2478915 RepID=A0A3L7JTA5_9BACI|nr:ATP-dependent DNA helicase [Falsibacillus albus]RLQ94078.1 ATP-dependent DNA helicase [Falsibacillus albus]